ncbi:MAG: PaaI family thioesterase [Myxococcales bacterium]|nr:PaaI family thioesterase [Myxococcales bacterium]
MGDERTIASQLAELTEELRTINQNAVLLGKDEQVLDALLAEVGPLADRFRAAGREKVIPLFQPHRPERVDEVLPYSPISGALNPVSPPVTMRGDGENLIGEATFGDCFEGPRGHLHGSVIAAVYDQLLAFANILSGNAGPTGSLTVRFHRPTPLHTKLTFVAKTERVEGRKVWTRGECRLGDQLLTEGEGLFIRLDPKRAYRPWEP